MLTGALLVYIFFSIVLEMLPISSSSHMFFFTELMRKNNFFIADDTVLSVVDFLVHGITLMVLAIFFKKRINLLLVKLNADYLWAARFIVRGFCVELLTLLLFIVVRHMHVSRDFFMYGFGVTTFFLCIDRYMPHEKKRLWRWYEPLLIGCGQGLAFLPGISRLAITYGMGRLLFFSRRHAFEFSFLIEAPLSLAAFLKGAYDLYFLNAAYLLNLPVCLTMVIAGVAAYQVLLFVYRCIGKGRWYLFGWYTLLLLLVLLIV